MLYRTSGVTILSKKYSLLAQLNIDVSHFPLSSEFIFFNIRNVLPDAIRNLKFLVFYNILVLYKCCNSFVTYDVNIRNGKLFLYTTLKLSPSSFRYTLWVQQRLYKTNRSVYQTFIALKTAYDTETMGRYGRITNTTKSVQTAFRETNHPIISVKTWTQIKGLLQRCNTFPNR